MAIKKFLTASEQKAVQRAKGQAFRIPRIKPDVPGHNCTLLYYSSPLLMRRLREELGLVIHPDAMELRLRYIRKYGNATTAKQYPAWRIDAHDPLIISYVPSRVFCSTAWPLTMRHVDFDGQPAIEVGLQSPGVDFGQCQQVRATRKWENEQQELVFIPGDGVVPNRAYWVQKMPSRPNLAATPDSASINERLEAKAAWEIRREQSLRVKTGIPYEKLKDKMQAVRKSSIERTMEFLERAEELEKNGSPRDLATIHSFSHDLS